MQYTNKTLTAPTSADSSSIKVALSLSFTPGFSSFMPSSDMGDFDVPLENGRDDLRLLQYSLFHYGSVYKMQKLYANEYKFSGEKKRKKYKLSLPCW